MVDGGVLAAAVGQVASAASRDDTLPMLTAVCVDISGEVMTLAATDRYRLAAREVTFAPLEPDVRALALVPARFMVEAARTFAAGVPVTVAFGTDGRERGVTRSGTDDQPHPAEGLVCFESGDRRITARLIAGEFIRYRNRFGDEFACRADLPAGPVIEAVRRAALVAERAGPVRLSFRSDQVVIEAHAEGRARAAETVGADFSGAEPVISFNPHYLLDGLTAAAASGGGLAVPSPAAASAGSVAAAGSAAAGPDAAGADPGVPQVPGGETPDAAGGDPGVPQVPGGETGRIRLEFNTPAKPALITWTQDEEREGIPAFRYLLVPLRVPERG